MNVLGKRGAAALALAAALTLGGCYDGYGYGGLSTGYGLYDDGYYGAPYAGYYGGGIGPAYGWYDNFYYPGTGYYIYDRGGARYRWNDKQRRYWEGRRAGHGDGRWNGRPDRPGDNRWAGRPDRPGDGRWNRPDRLGNGRWNRGRDSDRADRPGGPRPGLAPGVAGGGWSRPDRGARNDAARAARGQGVWGAFSRGERSQALGRGQSPGRGAGGRIGRGTVQP